MTSDQGRAGLSQAPLSLTSTFLAADVVDDDDDDERVSVGRLKSARERADHRPGLLAERLRGPRGRQRGSSRSTRAPPAR